MSERAFTAENAAVAMRSRTRFESAAVGLRLALSIAARFGIDIDEADPLRPVRPSLRPADDILREEAPELRRQLVPALRFAFEFAAGFGVRLANRREWQEEIARLRAADAPHPLTRLARVSPVADHGDLIVDLVLLATLPELHEGYAALCRLLHPQALPYPTVTLALNWLEHEAGCDPAAAELGAEAFRRSLALRDTVEALLLHSAFGLIGLIRLEGDGPWHGRMLRPGPGVFEGLNAQPPGIGCSEIVPGFRGVPGLDDWLSQPETQRAIVALQRGEPCLVALLGEIDTVRATRVRALLGRADIAAARVAMGAEMSADARLQAALDGYCVAFMHGAYPWLELGGDGSDAAPASPLVLPRSMSWELPVLVTTAQERSLPLFDLPILAVRVEPLSASARRTMWSTLLPPLADWAGVIAARYPIDPDDAKGVVADLALRQRTSEPAGRPLAIDDLAGCLRSRTAWRSRPGVRRIIPRAEWKDLLVPKQAAAQLTEAVLRVHQQLTVLDDWGFEQGRNDRRGLRLLFYGPPGTGKTLAAEAMARALGIDLLAVDIASLVSKWIGETEKNLAGVFELAERSRAVLLFDEADALFGRRTDASDAHDRYANLETAFLLQRLERYEGVAILATNLRASLDAAFTRRFEFIIEFPDPDAATRQQLWRLHIPETAPLATDVDLRELADWYQMSGAQIRNAALGAAFLAAAEGEAAGRVLGQRHFLRAIEREFEKAGKAHPGHPPGRSAAAPGSVKRSAGEATVPPHGTYRQ